MKGKLIILFLLACGFLQAQAPLNFSARLNVVAAVGTDPYTLTGVIQDELGLWSAADLNVSADSIYHLEGSDLLIYRITTIVLASGNNFVIIVDDIMDSGILPSTGTEWAAMAFTTNYQLPVEIGNLASPFKSAIDNRFKQRLDAALFAGGGGGGANLTFTGGASPYTLNSDTGTDVTFVQGSNVTLSRSGNALTIAAAASGITGVNDKTNMLDVTAPGGLIEVDADYTEGTVDNTYDPLDKIMKLDNSDGQYKAIQTGTYFGNGFVTLGTPAQTITTDKGFTGGLHYGAALLPTGIGFGSSAQTSFALKGGTIQPLAESVYQNFEGLYFESTQPPGGGANTNTFIGTGSDAGAGQSSFINFKVRPAGAGQNVVETFRMGATGALFGNSTVFSNGAGGGVINTPLGGIGFDGAASNYKLSGVSPTAGFGLFENGGLNMEVTPGTQSWTPFSDIRMKYDTVRLDITPANIRDFKSYTYKLNSSDSTMVGVIAQQIELLYPGLVRVMGGTIDTLGVDYNGLAAIAYAACASLQTQIDDMVLRGSGTLDFASTDAGASTSLTITVTGAVDGDPVSLGVPNGSRITDGFYTASVTSANTVTVTFINNGVALARDPASGTFKVSVIK